MKITNSMGVTVIGLALAGLLAYNGKAVPDAIGYITAIYVLGRGAQKVGIGAALAKDPNSNVQDVVDKIT